MPGTLAGEAAGLFGDMDLSAEAAAIIAAAWWSAADPQLSIAFGWVHDDVARRYPSLAALRLLLEPYGLRVPLALPTDSGPIADGWLRPVTDAEAPVRLTATAALLLDGWRPPAESGGSVPDRLRAPAEQAAALLSEGHRVVVRCADDEDGMVLARAVAARLGRALDTDAERPIAETALLARLGLVLPVAETETGPALLRLAAPGRSRVARLAGDRRRCDRPGRSAPGLATGAGRGRARPGPRRRAGRADAAARDDDRGAAP